MPHSPRVGAHLVMGEKPVTSPEALTFREARESLSPMGEETAKTCMAWSRPTGHSLFCSRRSGGALMTINMGVSPTPWRSFSLCFQSYSKIISETTIFTVKRLNHGVPTDYQPWTKIQEAQQRLPSRQAPRTSPEIWHCCHSGFGGGFLR